MKPEHVTEQDATEQDATEQDVLTETASELCRQAETEQEFDKLLEILSKLQRLIDARRHGKKRPSEPQPPATEADC